MLFILTFHFSALPTLYPSSRSSSCIHFLYIINLKQQPVENMGKKNIKSYATTLIHSPGEGREALRQIIQIFRLQM